MVKWSISAASLTILLGALLVIAVVLVLPQVDLLDTAFHRGTAPLVIKSRSLSAPAVSWLALTLFSSEIENNFEHLPVLVDASASSVTAALNSLRC
jgi:hypothetical protein